MSTVTIMRISGPQGCGKTTAAKLFAAKRAETLGLQGILEADLFTRARAMSGRAFHTIIVDGEKVWNAIKFDLATRLEPNVLVIITDNAA